MALGPPATFLLTDVVGSTELWDSETEEMAVALARHDDLVAAIVAEHDGVLVRTKGEGDSTFSVFGDVAAGVAAALALRLACRREPWPTRRPLELRIGLASGAAEHRASDWFGPAVNRAARLRSLAPSGAILVAANVASATAAPAGSRFVVVGRRRLRGFRDPETIVAVVEPDDVAPTLPPGGGVTNLVPPPTPTIGREQEVAELLDLLRDHRLITLIGAGGSGKTRLATEVGLAGASRFDAGVWLVELASVDDPDSVSELATAAAATFGESREPSLLVLDNCEHVLHTVARFVVDLLASTRAIHVLATSRAPLRIAGETLRPVRPLPGGESAASAEEIVASPAGALLVERARAVDPDVVVGPASALRRCLAVLDGLPLAIEIAASHVGESGFEALAAALEARFPVLPTAWRTGDLRHQSMAATIDWSLHLLDPGDRQALLALSVCRGFDGELAEQVTGQDAVTGTLRRLAASSLVMREGTGRYRLLEPIRQHAEALLRPEEAAAARDALAAAVLRHATRLLRSLYSDPEARTVLDSERGNLEQVLTWLVACGRGEDAARLFGVAGIAWFSTDQDTGRRWSQRIRPLLDDADPAAVAPARVADAMLHQGTALARQQLERALADATAAGRRGTMSLAAFWLAREAGLDATEPVSRARAEDAFRHALAVAEEAGDVVGQAWCTVWLAELAIDGGDLGTAERWLATALSHARAAHVIHPVPEVLRGMARVAGTRGDTIDRDRLLDQGVALGRKLNDPWQLLGLLVAKAALDLDRRDLTTAAIDVAEACALALGVADTHRMAESLALTVRLNEQLGDAKAASTGRSALRAWLASECPHEMSPAFEGVRFAPIDDLEASLARPPSVADALRLALDRLHANP